MKRRTTIVIGTAVLVVVLIVAGLFVGGVFDSSKSDDETKQDKTTSEIMSEFRNIMKKNQYVDVPIQAYFIPSVDEHQVSYFKQNLKKKVE